MSLLQPCARTGGIRKSPASGRCCRQNASVALAGGRGCRRRPGGGEARDVNQSRAGVARGLRHGAGSIGVDLEERPRVDGGDDAGQMDDGVETGEGLAKFGGVERRVDGGCLRRRPVARAGTDDGLHHDAAAGQRRRGMPADETGRAGDRQRMNHAMAF